MASVLIAYVPTLNEKLGLLKKAFDNIIFALFESNFGAVDKDWLSVVLQYFREGGHTGIQQM